MCVGQTRIVYRIKWTPASCNKFEIKQFIELELLNENRIENTF